MLDHALERPSFYTFTQRLWYRPGRQQAYVNEWIRPRPGDRILDVGCGPGTLLTWMPDVDYTGYDPNPRYIAEASAHFGRRGRFHCGYLTHIPDGEIGRFDIVLANGVLHHLSDDQVRQVMSLASQALKPRGRMVTRDGCYERGQKGLARWLMKWDRGAFVRTQEGYDALFQRSFEVVRVAILRDALRLPYSLIHFEAVKRGDA